MHWSKRNQMIRLLVYFLLLTLIVLLAMRYLMLRASLEQLTVELNLRNVRVMLPVHSRLQGEKGNAKPLNSVFPFLTELGLEPLVVIGAETTLAPGEWGYDKKAKRLVYRIQHPNYFRSMLGLPLIVGDFFLIGDDLQLKVYTYQWCRNKGIWGCDEW